MSVRMLRGVSRLLLGPVSLFPSPLDPTFALPFLFLPCRVPRLESLLLTQHLPRSTASDGSWLPTPFFVLPFSALFSHAPCFSSDSHLALHLFLLATFVTQEWAGRGGGEGNWGILGMLFWA